MDSRYGFGLDALVFFRLAMGAFSLNACLI
jgi:hypothetical protein